jgi:hypothetical protein
MGGPGSGRRPGSGKGKSVRGPGVGGGRRSTVKLPGGGSIHSRISKSGVHSTTIRSGKK